MTQTFTQDHVILYLYNELDEAQIGPFLTALSSNNELMQFYSEFKEIMQTLDLAQVPNPSETSIQIILEESSSRLTANA